VVAERPHVLSLSLPTRPESKQRIPRNPRTTGCKLSAQCSIKDREDHCSLLRTSQLIRTAGINIFKPPSWPRHGALICQSAPLIKKRAGRATNCTSCARGKSKLGPEHPSRASSGRNTAAHLPRRSRRPAETIFSPTSTLPRSSSTTSRPLCFPVGLARLAVDVDVVVTNPNTTHCQSLFSTTLVIE
jgi:hypothetical protein